MNKKEYKIIESKFKEILNNCWCIYSFDKGKKQWAELSKNVPKEYRRKIDVEIQHIFLKHGLLQSRLALKHEIEKYLKSIKNP